MQVQLACLYPGVPNHSMEAKVRSHQVFVVGFSKHLVLQPPLGLLQAKDWQLVRPSTCQGALLQPRMQVVEVYYIVYIYI